MHSLVISGLLFVSLGQFATEADQRSAEAKSQASEDSATLADPNADPNAEVDSSAKAKTKAKPKSQQAIPRATTHAEKRAEAAVARVIAIKNELGKSTGLTPIARNKLKKRLQYAANVARESIQAVENERLAKAQAAYLEKMMPIWIEQQRKDAQFNLEVAKTQALQQMALTNEKKRQDDLWIQWQRNQILQSLAR